MGDTLHIETRARSRSKTPFLRSHCDQESCAHAGEEGHQHVKKKKEPTVTTIIEEKTEILMPQPAISNKKQTTTKTQQTTISTKTSDYSSDDPSPNSSRTKSSSPIPINNKDVSVSKSTSTMTTTVKTSTLNSTENKKNISVSESVSRQRTINDLSRNGSNHFFVASPISSFSEKSKEISQNEINTAFEKTHLQTSTPIVLRSSKNVQRMSFEDTRNGDTSDHIAYREYKEAGEYWKKYPKTDYTYSKLSPHRRVIAPGIVGMPNMSRKSLENHGDRINFMIDRDPLQEEFIRKRYETSKQYRSTQKTSRDNYLTYDSQDEVDYAQLQGYNLNSRRYMKYSQTDQSWIASIVTRIITTFYNFASVVVGNNDSNFSSTNVIKEQKGFFRRLGSAISSPMLSIYNKLISLLVVDTCILRSTSPKMQTKKRLFIFMLLLFPFLFLAAWGLLAGDNDREPYLMQIQNLLPVSLLGLRNWFQFELNNPIKLNFDSKSNNFKSSQFQSVTNQIQKSMGNEEYENILNHVNSYVQELVDKKLEEHNANAIHGSTKITSEMSAVIAKVVQKQIENVIPVISQMAVAEPYVMSEVEIEKIIEKVKEKLSVMPAGSDSTHFSMSQENLEQISKLIKQNIEINNHNLNIIEKLDIDEVLFRILQSPKLLDYVDARIDRKLLPMHDDMSSDRAIINHQQLIIDELNNEIKFIKSQLSGQLNENEDLHLSLIKLTTDQRSLSDRFDQHETNVDQRFSNLLREIDLKLSGINENQFIEINRQIKLSLMDIFQYKNENRNIDEVDLQNWMRNIFVAKEFLENRLKELQAQNKQLMHEEIDRSGAILIRDISEKLKIEILSIIESRQKEHNVLVTADLRNTNTLDETEIRNIVQKVLSVYDADKTGMVDYALESAGGQILSTRCTENYQTKSAQISIFGIPLWYPSNTPRIAIAPNVQPGECWAFQGFPGYLVLKLNSLVYVTGFTLEHIPKTLAPNGRIDSAPRKFAVYGLQRENESDGVQFGEYEFLNNDISMQYFPVQNQSINSPYEVVELKIENNHGHTQYTCLYRFRVHGKPTNS